MAPNDYIDKIIGLEGGYSNNPADRGGETMWGITAAVARAFGYTGPMAQMTRDTAIAIYRARYWTQPKFDRVQIIDGDIAEKLLDIGVNMGPSTGIKFLQRALNVLNNQAKAYPDIGVDGGIGNLTLAALAAFIGQRGNDGRRVLLGMIASQQSVRYMELAEGSASQEAFEYGWQLNRALGVAA